MRLWYSYSLSCMAVLMLSMTIGCGGADTGTDGTDTSSETGAETGADDPANEETVDAPEVGADDETETEESTGTETETEEPDQSSSAPTGGVEATPVSSAKVATEEGFGSLVVQFVYDGDAPAREKETVGGQDAAYCGKHDILSKDLIVNPENKGVANIVGWLSVGRGDEPPKAPASNASIKAEPVVLDNKGCQFEPHMVIVQTGQKLVIKNSDEVGHNAKANLLKNRADSFSDNLPAGQELEYSFENAESVPMIVECTVHPWMQARLFILDHPFFGKSDTDGKLVIPNLPVGKVTLRFNHEKAGNLRDVTINGEETDRKGEVEFEIKAGENDFGVVKLPASLFE